MTGGFELLAAALPLLIAGGLIVGLLWPATRAMPIAWISALAIGYLVWNMPPGENPAFWNVSRTNYT